MNYLRKIASAYAEPFEFCIGLVPQQFVRAVRTQRGGKGAWPLNEIRLFINSSTEIH